MISCSYHFLQIIIKDQLKTTVTAERLDKNRYRLVQLFSRYNETTLKKYIEMRLETAKQLAFLKYQKLINKGH